MKLLTLNTHSLIEPAYEAKRDAFVEFIRKEQPDVFALQEVNQTAAAPLLADVPAGYYPCPGNMVLLKADNHAAAVARMLEEAGCAYHWSWLPAKIGYDRYDEGMAVFSRAPITAAENLLLSQINDYNNWKTRRALGICAGDVWYYAVHMGWWKDEEEPFADQWNILAAAAGAKPLAFLLGDFNSEADVRGEGYDLILRSGWQDIDGATYYYDPSTHQPVTGQQVIQGNVYTFAADGALNRTARGIDVSKFQGSIDWNAVKSDGITFAIIRCGYRGYGSGALVEDSTYRRNIQGAINAGLRVGVYFYSQAINEAEAVEEASMVLSLVSGYSLPLGVYYDTESVGGGRANALSAAERTACAVAFCETIRSAGYSAGVYSYASWFYNALNFANISKYNIWIAQYRDTLSFSYKHNIWQYTGSGSVKGISKPVDMNIG